jgi:glycine betaine/proline transport system substrate-binding protein
VPEEPPEPEETKTNPPLEPEPIPESVPQPVPEPMTATVPVAIETRRGYGVLQNNDIKFGIRVINPTSYLIADVETILSYPKIHNEKVYATIVYRDHTGERHVDQMRPKEVHCVCPFLKEKPMREGEFAELAAKSEYIDKGLSFSGINVIDITAFIKESCAHRLSTIGEHEMGNTFVLNLAGESIGEKAYYLLTTVIQPYKEKDVTQIAFRAYSDKTHGLQGFLNEITKSISHLVGSVQSAKEIGVIEHKQVIEIINSGTGDIIMGDKQVKQVAGGDIVGGTKITGDVVAPRSRIGGADNVIPNEGTVQRSEIGSRQRCPNCGNETQTNEKFCPNCGAAIAQGE